MRRPRISLFALLVLWALGSFAAAQDLPLLGRLPKLDPVWSLQSHGSEIGGSFKYAWATFSNSETGDVLAFAANSYADPKITRKPGDSATQQTLADIFPGGVPQYALTREQRRDTGWSIEETLENHINTLEPGPKKGGALVESLAYSFVYTNRESSIPNRLAHGFVITSGGTAIFIQQTSSRVFTSEHVREVANALLANRP